ncbi:MAG: high-affinity iron transporter [Spirochaeta sp.]|nr:high-affinity iron transporter [Spirochaeta sp.]
MQSFIIMFRETLEAALVIAIVLSYLKRSGRRDYNISVYRGIAAGILLSIIGGWLFQLAAGGFSGKKEQIFEGITMLAGAALLTTMILWMMKQSNLTEVIKQKVEISQGKQWGIFFLIAISILREGIESVIFLSAANFVSEDQNLMGAILGLLVAVLVSYLFVKGSLRISLKKFFLVTNILLILFAAGLMAHGIHELQEAGLIPTFIQHAWDINPSATIGEGFPLLHENGNLGSIGKGLFGYNGNPSLLEVLSYLLYLAAVVFIGRAVKSGNRTGLTKSGLRG